jgi:hypothetical protein
MNLTIGRRPAGHNDAYHLRVTETLSGEDVGTLREWVRGRGIGSELTDVTPVAGGTQNIVVRLRVDGRPVVLRRPPAHPRPTSNKTLLREIAVLRTLAGTTAPHRRIHRRLRRSHGSGRGVLFDGRGRRVQSGQRGIRRLCPRRDAAPPRRAAFRGKPCAAWQCAVGGQRTGSHETAGILSGTPGSAVVRHARGVSARPGD